MAEIDMIGQQQAVLGRLLELSNMMLQNARERQWVAVADLQSQREQVIHEFFSEELALDQHRLAEVIQMMIDSDKQLTALGMEERKALQQQIHKMKQRQNAVKAYDVNQSTLV